MDELNNNLQEKPIIAENQEAKKEPSLSEIFDFIKLQDAKISSLQSEITGLKNQKQEVKKENVIDNKEENTKVNDNSKLKEEIKKEMFLESLNETQKKIIDENPELLNLSVNSLKNIFKNQPTQTQTNTENDKKKLSGVEIKENAVIDNGSDDDVFVMKRKADEANGIKDVPVFKTKLIR